LIVQNLIINVKIKEPIKTEEKLKTQKIMRNKVLFLVLVFSLLMVSCDSKRIYDDYKSVPDEWNKDSIMSFKIHPPDSINPYNLFVNLRNTNKYKYSNIFLIVEMVFPHGKTIKDTLEYRMADPSGKLLGAGLMDVKENKLWYKEDVVFNESGEYTVNIQHAMRENGKVNGVTSLEGITDIGFRIESPTSNK
jgi:gliding motility-associated lipoprotein GldH